MHDNLGAIAEFLYRVAGKFVDGLTVYSDCVFVEWTRFKAIRGMLILYEDWQAILWFGKFRWNRSANSEIFDNWDVIQIRSIEGSRHSRFMHVRRMNLYRNVTICWGECCTFGNMRGLGDCVMGMIRILSIRVDWQISFVHVWRMRNHMNRVGTCTVRRKGRWIFGNIWRLSCYIISCVWFISISADRCIWIDERRMWNYLMHRVWVILLCRIGCSVLVRIQRIRKHLVNRTPVILDRTRAAQMRWIIRRRTWSVWHVVNIMMLRSNIRMRKCIHKNIIIWHRINIDIIYYRCRMWSPHIKEISIDPFRIGTDRQIWIREIRFG